MHKPVRVGIPYAMAFATELTTPGTELVWNYDARSTRGGFTIGLKDVTAAPIA